MGKLKVVLTLFDLATPPSPPPPPPPPPWPHRKASNRISTPRDSIPCTHFRRLLTATTPPSARRPARTLPACSRAARQQRISAAGLRLPPKPLRRRPPGQRNPSKRKNPPPENKTAHNPKTPRHQRRETGRRCSLRPRTLQKGKERRAGAGCACTEASGLWCCVFRWGIAGFSMHLSHTPMRVSRRNRVIAGTRSPPPNYVGDASPFP